MERPNDLPRPTVRQALTEYPIRLLSMHAHVDQLVMLDATLVHSWLNNDQGG